MLPRNQRFRHSYWRRHLLRLLQLSSRLVQRLVKRTLRASGHITPFKSRLQRRLLLRNRRRTYNAKAGFILPMVAMVSVVVVLLTTAILLRAFDRARNASEVRVNQAVLNAASPGIDRARAKIDALLNDPALSRLTPSDQALFNVIQTNPKYTFGDETRLKLGYDINKNGVIQIQPGNTYTLEDDETLTTAWRFPVDTDNNGKFDSFTLYGIYFRNPSSAALESQVGFNRERNPLLARTPPMDTTLLNGQCPTAATSGIPLSNDWYKSASKLKKSFFVFVANVPITTPESTKYETYRGEQGFSALELQQDRSLMPLNHNTVWFQDDLEITPNEPFRLNGRIQTNGNLLVGGHQANSVQLYQISSKNSCFYQQENSKIIVGGNVGNGNTTDTLDQAPITVDLYSNYPDGSNPEFSQINSINKSTNSSGGAAIAYNDAAYNQRIALMKQTALSTYYCQENGYACNVLSPQKSTVLAIPQYPQEVKANFATRIDADPSLDTYAVLAEEIEIYLRDRTRRVPYSEISAPDGTGAKYPYDSAGNNVDPGVFRSGSLEPPPDWRNPVDDNNQLTKNTALVQLNPSQLEATWPQQQRQEGKETLLGDRVIVGNNLPAFWKKGNDYVAQDERQLLGNGINWTKPNNKPRYRHTQVQQLFGLGVSSRNGFWEAKAAGTDSTTKEGGLRIVTGAGIYQNKGNPQSSIPSFRLDSFLPDLSKQTKLDNANSIPKAPLIAGEPTATPYTLVWHDTMPMSGGLIKDKSGKLVTDTAPPDLRMRATAVYHYTQNTGTNQTPIACISSYYDPSDATTAQNGKYDTKDGTFWGDGGTNLPANPAPAITAPPGTGRSNNGVVYPPPYTSNNARTSTLATYLPELKKQAKLMFPNGRIVNEPLQKALQKVGSSGMLLDYTKPLSLSENSAIDTAICALEILDGTLSPSDVVIPHGAIKEATFLDGREIQAIDRTVDPTKQKDPIGKFDPITQAELSSNNYNIGSNFDLPLEQRQPLEIRVTEINFDTDYNKGITRRTIGKENEYLLPNNGLIYASRDDALPDASDPSDVKQLLSPTDFRLDPTRRPNGIRIINGNNLARRDDNNYVAAETGLLLATNLPVYVKGNFNSHLQPGEHTEMEEFSETLTGDWGNFYTRTATLNPYYACRPGKLGCPNYNGDYWRPATIIADAITLLSANFQDGFRDQGDFDLQNHTGSLVVNSLGSKTATELRNQNGFFDNSFVTSAAYWDTNDGTGFPTDTARSSYLTNGVTPIQRRVRFNEYLMEVCLKLPVETCGNSDWFIDPSANPPLTSSGLNFDGKDFFNINKHKAGTTAQPAAPPYQRYARRVVILGGFASNSNRQNQNSNQNSSNPQQNQPNQNPSNNNQTNQSNQNPSSTQQNQNNQNPANNNQPNQNSSQNLFDSNNQPNQNSSNTNNQPNQNSSNPQQNQNNQNSSNPQQNQNSNQNSPNNQNQLPTPVGIDNSGVIRRFPYDGTKGTPRQVENALWFQTTNNHTDPTTGNGYTANNLLLLNQQNPHLLSPVLQIHTPEGSPGGNLSIVGTLAQQWLQHANQNTTFNGTFISGNSPSRLDEEPTGLPHFLRFLESWQGITSNIKGNFIQFQRSAYATAPFNPVRLAQTQASDGSLSMFGYLPTQYPNNSTPTITVPYYTESSRQWSFDVGLLSELPDLFAQNFTQSPVEPPDEFFREVERNDPWVQTLLCAAKASDRLGGPGATYTQYAIPDKSQRSAQCQTNYPNYPANP